MCCRDMFIRICGLLRLYRGSNRETKAPKRINGFCVQCNTWPMCINVTSKVRAPNGR